METKTITTILYFTCFIIITVISVMFETEKKNQKIARIVIGKGNITFHIKLLWAGLLIVLILSILAGIRSGVGTDFDGYKKIYETYSNMSNFSFLRYGGFNTEIGYYYLCRFSNFIFNNFQILLFITGLLIYGLFIWYIKNIYSNVYVPIMIFGYCALYFGASFNIMRQIIASSIILLSYKYVEKRNLFKFLFTIFIAVCFHTSAIFCIPFYFMYIPNNKMGGVKRKLIIIGSLLLPFGFSLFFNIMSQMSIFSKYAVTYNDYVVTNINYVSLIVRFPMAIILFRNYKEMIKLDTVNNFYYLLYIFEFLSIIIGYKMHWAFRLIYYVMFAELILIGKIIYNYRGNKKVFIKVFSYLYYAFYFYYLYIFSGHDAIVPFITIFH